MAVQRVVKGDSEAAIDAVNQWMRAQPWYQAQLQQWGVDPSRVKLSEAQRNQLVALAQANGVQVDQGNIEVDPAGNFNPIGHKLRNGLIAAGLGGAAIAAPFALGALAGGGGASVPALASGVPTAIGGASALPAVAGGAGAAAGAGGGFSLGSLIGPAISGVTSALGNRTQTNANNQANQYLQQATQQGLGINQNVYDQSLGAARNAYDTVSAGYQPYQAVGQQGLNTLASLAGQNRADFTLPTQAELEAMPGYQAGLRSRIRGANASAAARGGLLTGGAVKAAEKAAGDYTDQNYATLASLAANAYNMNGQNFDRPFNRAQTLAQLGQYGISGAANAANNLANQTINAGGQYGQNATNLLTAGANANAANSVNNGRTNANTITTLGNLIQQYFANQGY